MSNLNVNTGNLDHAEKSPWYCNTEQKLTFGKYKGTSVSSLDTMYIFWLLSQQFVHDNLGLIAAVRKVAIQRLFEKLPNKTYEHLARKGKRYIEEIDAKSENNQSKFISIQELASRPKWI